MFRSTLKHRCLRPWPITYFTNAENSFPAGLEAGPAVLLSALANCRESRSTRQPRPQHARNLNLRITWAWHFIAANPFACASSGSLSENKKKKSVLNFPRLVSIMADIAQSEEKCSEGPDLSHKPSIGVVSCDDEGYETAGKKTLSTRPKSSKEGRKVRRTLYNLCFLFVSQAICKQTFAATCCYSCVYNIFCVYNKINLL